MLERAGGRVTGTDDVAAAARDADVLYTDIWVSVGKEAEEARREAELGPYWINDSVVKLAKPDALVMHCLPAHRGRKSMRKLLKTMRKRSLIRRRIGCMCKKRFWSS